MNIYIDIEGTMLGKNHQPASGVGEFLHYMTDHHTCFWLSSYCNDGTVGRVVEVLGSVYGEDVMQYARKVSAASWLRFKSEGIDFYQDFRWIDDHLTVYDEVILKNERVFDKLIKVDLEANPHQLDTIRI